MGYRAGTQDWKLSNNSVKYIYFQHRSRTYCRHSGIISWEHHNTRNLLRQCRHSWGSRLDHRTKKSITSLPVGTLRHRKVDALRKLADIFQGQITEKNKLETTETRTKIVEKRKIGPSHIRGWRRKQRPYHHPQYPKKRKSKPGTPKIPHQISFEGKEYSPPRVEADLVSPAPQPVHKYSKRQKNG